MIVGAESQMREENSLRGEDGSEEAIAKPSPMRRGFRFWTIIFALCVTGLLGALENTVVSTSMPTIVEDLNIGDNYIWITNSFFLTRYLLSPIARHSEPSLILTLSGILQCSGSAPLWPTSECLWSSMVDHVHRRCLHPGKRHLWWRK